MEIGIRLHGHRQAGLHWSDAREIEIQRQLDLLDVGNVATLQEFHAVKEGISALNHVLEWSGSLILLLNVIVKRMAQRRCMWKAVH